MGAGMQLALSHNVAVLAKLCHYVENRIPGPMADRASIFDMAKSGMQQKLFREPAIAALGHRWLSDVVIATPPRAVVAAAAAIIVCFLLGVAALVVRVSERLPAAGVLLPADRIIRVLAPRSGIVRDLAIEDGDRVRAGQRLFDIRAPGAGNGGSTLAAQEQSVRRELELVAAETAADVAATRDALLALDNRGRALQSRLAAASRQVRLLGMRSGVAIRRRDRAAAVVARGGLAVQQLDALEDAVLAVDIEKAVVEQAREAVRQDIEHLDTDRRQLRHAAEQRRLQQLGRREKLERELLSIVDASGSQVLAPAAGVIGGVLVAEDNPVQTGELLLQLYEPGSELEAFLYISADDANRVRVGQAVELRLRAYPYRLHGTFPARIRWLSTVPVPASAAPLPLPQRGAVYELRAVPQPGPSSVRWRALGPGASFEADIVYARWPLFRWILRRTRRST
jgi:membrane fusion protein